MIRLGFFALSALGLVSCGSNERLGSAPQSMELASLRVSANSRVLEQNVAGNLMVTSSTFLERSVDVAYIVEQFDPRTNRSISRVSGVVTIPSSTNFVRIPFADDSVRQGNRKVKVSINAVNERLPTQNTTFEVVDEDGVSPVYAWKCNESDSGACNEWKCQGRIEGLVAVANARGSLCGAR